MNPRTRKLITRALAVLLVSLFGYGVLAFGDQPITLRPDGAYRGKQNQVHTREEFERFRSWESAFRVVFPAGMAVMAFLNREEIINKSVNRRLSLERDKALKATDRSARR